MCPILKLEKKLKKPSFWVFFTDREIHSETQVQRQQNAFGFSSLNPLRSPRRTLQSPGFHPFLWLFLQAILPTQSAEGFIDVISFNFHNQPNQAEWSDCKDKETET